MTDHNQQSSCKYVQVNNPEPVFTVPRDYTPRPFSLKLMVKANGFTESFSFDIASAMSRRDGIRKRKPPHFAPQSDECVAHGDVFYYDPLSNKVLRSLRRLPRSADLQLNLFLAKCPLHEQSGHWNRWKKILNLLPAHRIAIQLLRFFSPLSCSNFLAYFHSL
ncbi:replication protein (plasmid) [Klebsiella quasipneumoniae]|nr:replication protein [Klebsiella quasipneumoniae]